MKKQEYLSNPFRLTFRGLSQFFNVNQTWAIIIIVLGVLGNIPNFFDDSSKSTGPGDPALSAATVLLLIALALIGIFFVFVLVVIYEGAITYVTYKTIKGQKAGVKEALKASLNKFWTLAAIQVVVGLKIFGGLLLFIVPGIRAALRYDMVMLPVFAADKNYHEAQAEMKELTKDHLIEILGMNFAAGIVPIVSPVLKLGGQSLIYPQLTDLKASGKPKPPVHWLNYLAFIVIPVVLLIVGSIALLVIATK